MAMIQVMKSDFEALQEANRKLKDEVTQLQQQLKEKERAQSQVSRFSVQRNLPS